MKVIIEMKKTYLIFLFMQIYYCMGLLFAASNNNKFSLSLAEVFGEGMVLQQKDVNNICGLGTPSSIVYLEFQNQKKKTKVKPDGTWMISLKKLYAGGPFRFKVTSGNDSIIFSKVYVGEVWLATGQSNMERKLVLSENGKNDAYLAKNENIHFMIVPKVYFKGQDIDDKLEWKSAIAPQVENMSAIGYYFARRLQNELNVPIGIICCYCGGTPAEAWVKEETLKKNKKLLPILENYYKVSIKNDSIYEEKMKEYKKLYRIYNDSILMGYKNAVRPFEPVGPKHHKRPCGLYYTMLQRIIPYTVKGVIWYQGEGNAERAEQYRTLFPELIKQWRKDFKKKNLPFYFVQLSNYDHPFWKDNPNWAELREAQLLTWKNVKNTAMVVSIDKGEKNNLHPIYKKDIGERLAKCASHLLYKKNIPYSGPIYKSMKIKNNKIEIDFNFIYSGLSYKGEKLKGFLICDSSHNFVTANAIIKDNKVIVWSDKIKKPLAVRYGWSNWTEANLFNNAGLPASPFRTDNFKLSTDGIYYPIKIR